MKKFLQTLMLVAVMALPWNASAQLNFTSDFESDADTSEWVFASGSQTNHWTIGTDVHYAGSKAMYVTNGTTANYSNSMSSVSYAYHSFTLTGEADVFVGFDWKCNGESNYDYLRVFIVPDSQTVAGGSWPPGFSSAYSLANATVAGWYNLGGKLNLNSNWSNFSQEVHLDAGDYKLVFLWSNDASGGSNPPACVDNVVLSEISCSRVHNLSMSNVTPTSFDIVWGAVEDAASYIVEYDTVSFTPGSCDNTETAYTNSLALTDLNPNTVYYVAVKVDCGSSMSNYTTAQFRTPCAAVDSLPYAEDFESWATGSTSAFNPCWTKHCFGSTTAYPYVYASAASTGANGFYFYGYHPSSATTQPTYNWAVLPLFEEDLTNLRLSFDLKRYNTTTDYYTTEMYVGVMSNPDDITTFDTIEYFNLRNEAGNAIVHCEAYFNNYQGDGTFIAIFSGVPSLYGTASYTYNYGYLDNVVVDLAPSCLAVTNLRAENVGLTSADLVWSERADATSWIVEYSDAPFTPQQGDGEIEYASDTLFTFDMLDSATTYYAYVYADCGGDYSEPVMVSFRTLEASPAEMPFYCNFEEEGNNGWSFVNGTQTNHWMIGTGDFMGGQSGMYITNNDQTNSYSNSSASVVYATRTIHVADTGVYSVSFNWKANGESSYDYIRAYLAPTDAVLLPGILYSGIGTSGSPSGWIALDNNAKLNLQGSWQTQTNEITFNTPGYYNFVFVWRNDGSGGSAPAGAIDNVSMSVLTCPAPTNLTINAAADTAQIQWTAAPGTNAWEVVYGTAGFDPTDENVVPTQTTTNEFIATGLTAGYEYQFYVRTDCGGDFSDWVGPVSAISGTPYVMNASVDTLIGCGYIVKDNGGDGQYANSSNNTLYIYPEDTLTQSLVLSGWSYTESSYDYVTIYDGLGTSGSMIFTDNGVDQLQNVGPFLSETGVFTITFVSDGSVQRDGFEFVVACVDKPACQSPNNVRATNVTNNSATISWNARAAYDAVTVYWGTSPLQTNAIDSITVTGTTPFVDIDQLSGNTTYHVWVRGECNGGYTLMAEGSFTTDVNCAPVENLRVSGLDYWAFGLSWDEPTDGEAATAYVVSYKLASAPASAWVSDTVTGTFYYVGGLSMGTTYNYKVNSVCDGDLSAAATGTVATRSCGFEMAEGTATQQYIPSYEFYGYSYTQQIYLASELSNAGDTLTSISFYADDVDDSRTNSWSIYLGNTTQSSFTGTSNYVPIANQTLVYTGTKTISSTGWVTFNFTTPFIRNRNQNLVVSFDDNTGSYTSDIPFRTNSVSGTRAIYFYQDGSDINPASPSASSSGTISGAVNQIQLTYSDCQVPDCPAPMVFANNVQTNSVELVWYPQQTGVTYEVSYREVGVEDWTEATSSTSANSYNLSGLNPALSYEARVTFLCGSDTLAGVARFSTACGRVALPYTENFQNSDYGYFSRNCWTIGTSNDAEISQNTYPSVVSLSGDPDNKLLLLYQGGYVVLPRVDASLTDLQVRFTLLQGGDNVPLLFGILSDPTAPINSMTVLDTLVRSQFTTESAFNFTRRLNNQADTAGCIAFWSEAGVNYSFLDNIVVEYIPSCASVDSAVVTAVTTTTATIDIYGNAASYVVEYGPHGFVPGTGLTATITSTTAQLTNLDNSTSYDAYVYSICGTDTSTASNVVRFTTECDVITNLPYVQDFEFGPAGVTNFYELPNCWAYQMIAQDSLYTVGNYRPNVYYTSTSGYTTSGTHCLFLYGRTVVALPEFGVSVDSLMLSFHAYSSSTSYALEIGLVDHVDSGFASTFVPFDTIIYPAYGDQGFITLYLTDYQGLNGGHIAFRNFYNGYDYDYSYHYIDDIVIDRAPTCIAPQAVRLTGLTSSSASLAWRTSQAHNYQIAYGLATDSIASYTIDNDTTFHAHTINGLTPNTEYTAYVRGICGNDTTDWSAPVTFTTHCTGVSVPYFEDFDNVTTSTTSATGVLPSCWTYTMTGTGSYATGSYLPQVYYSSSYANSGSYSLRLYGIGYHALPPMNVPLDSLQLTFSLYTTSTYYGLEVGVLEGNTFVPVQDVTPSASSTHTDVTVYFNNYTGNGGLIAFRNYYTTSTSTYYSYNYIDDIAVDYAPTCMPVSHITRASAGATSINLDWTDNTPANSWQIEYGQVGFTRGNGTFLNVTSHPVNITGFDTLTSYDFYVRPICSVGDTGFWAMGTVGTAICDNATIATTANSGNSTTTQYAPGYNYYKNSVSEVIIDSAELAGIGDITAWSFISLNGNGNYWDDAEIWMANSDKSVFTSSTDWVDVTAANGFQKVYDGSLSYSEAGEHITMLDSNFTWDGHSNIIIAVVRTADSYQSGCSHAAANCTGYKTIYAYSDTYTPDLTDLAGSMGSATKGYVTYRPIYNLYSCGASCSAPAVNVTHVDFESATIAWSGIATQYEVAVTPMSSTNWPAETLVNGNTYTFTGLYPQTEYAFRVRALCDTLGNSNWTEGYFTTDSLPCFAPTSVTTSNVTVNSVTVAWTNNAQSTAQAWVVNVFNSTTNIMDTVRTNPATITGLYDNTQYFVTVQSICSALISSDWSDTVSFTTTTCQGVSNVQVSNITTTGATVTWTPGAGQTAWEVSYGNRDFVEGQGTVVSVTSTTYQITGLEPESRYDVYVRSICAEGITSDWSPVRQFETPEEGGVDGIEGVEGNYSLTIYPNPTAGNTTISLRGIEGDVTISVVDMNGRTIQSDRLSCGSDCVKTLNVEGLAQGTYFVRVLGDGINSVRKLIVR